MNIRLSPSWAFILVSVLLHAVTLFPTMLGFTLFVANVGVVVLVRFLARKGM